MDDFNAKDVTEKIILWLRDWFEKNGKNCKAIVGISGGKDSTVVASLCVAALGKESVVGVMMPNGIQNDIEDSKKVCQLLGITSVTVNIKEIYDAAVNNLRHSLNSIGCDELTEQSLINLAPRLRMATLYGISQTINGRVLNTCNLSEDWIGYSTRYGDSIGDVAPIANLTVSEVRLIGLELGLPYDLIYKTPSDGLCGKTDEDNLGFTYDVLDKYIRTGVCDDEEIRDLIDKKHLQNKFKLELMPIYKYGVINTKVK